MKWDAYEIRARIAPTIIISLPIVITLSLISLSFLGDFIQSFFGAGITLGILIYGLSFVPRYFGRKIEHDLWMGWGGVPSTRIIRWEDATLGNDLKRQIHMAVEQCCNIKLCPKEEERANPHKADGQINQAFMHVKAIVRSKEPNGLWSTHNAEYGFHRNLLGSKYIWLITAIVCTALLGLLWYYSKSQLLLLGITINSLLVVISIVCGWYFLPNSTKLSADRYAESMWTTFLVIANAKNDENEVICPILSIK